jgi:hypothetical protein
MNLEAKIPATDFNEVSWVLRVLVHDFLGVELRCVPHGEASIELTSGGRLVRFGAGYFSRPELRHKDGIQPHRLLTLWDTRELGLPIHLRDPHVPVLFGVPGGAVAPHVIQLDWDLFGSAYFLLSRLEESSNTARDVHGRVMLAETAEGRLGLLNRPLVDEYVEILRSCIEFLWPELRLKPRRFSIDISCDLDHVFCPSGAGFVAMARKIGADFSRHRNCQMLGSYLRNYRAARTGNHEHDPYFQAIYTMMEINEDCGNQICFNVKPMSLHPVLDGHNDLDYPPIRSLLRDIHRRGHEIGFHPGYLSYDNEPQFIAELERLKSVLSEEGIHQEIARGRQHYLRWAAPVTPRLWEKSGLKCDSTLGFAEQPGFRCGTSRRFRMYDIQARRSMDLYQQPLIAMETSVIEDQYAGYGRTREAYELMADLKEICRFYGGCFTLLWHNSTMRTRWDWNTYRELCSNASPQPAGSTTHEAGH